MLGMAANKVGGLGEGVDDVTNKVAGSFQGQRPASAGVVRASWLAIIRQLLRR